MSYEEFNWKSNTKTRYYLYTRSNKINPKIKSMNDIFHNYCEYMHCKQYNTNQSLWSAGSRAIIGRMTADIRCLSADGCTINCHRPTVWRSSADWRPMIGRPSADIMMKKSSKRRPIVGRSSGDHRPTLHRWQNPWKSADRLTKLLTWVLRQKSRRPTKKSSKIGADVGRQSADVARFSHFWLADRRATVGLGNVTVVL